MTNPANPASAAATAAPSSRCAYTSVLNRSAVMALRLIRARIAGDLDQVAVRVAAVVRCHRAERTGLGDRALGDGHSARPQVRPDLVWTSSFHESPGELSRGIGPAPFPVRCSGGPHVDLL